RSSRRPRRLHEDRAAGRKGTHRRACSEVEQTDQAGGRRRSRATNDGGGHRRSVRTGIARRPDGRRGVQPETSEADGHRIERHGSRGQPGWRHTDTGRFRLTSTTRYARPVIDSHCHLADPIFADDLEAVIARARTAGVERALVILAGGDTEEAAQAQRILTVWPDARVSIGVHPHQAHEFADDPDRSADLVKRQWSATPAARAIGEIRLHYHYPYPPPHAPPARLP